MGHDIILYCMYRLLIATPQASPPHLSRGAQVEARLIISSVYGVLMLFGRAPQNDPNQIEKKLKVVVELLLDSQSVKMPSQTS